MSTAINRSELARVMLLWEKQRIMLAELEQLITETVLELGRTVDTGNVRATFSAGRRRFDYEAAAKARGIAPSKIKAFTAVREVIDWSGVCKDQEITDIPATQSKPSVKVKLMDGG